MVALSSEQRTLHDRLSPASQAYGLSNVHLSWVGEEFVASGFRSYVKYNEERDLVASGASILYSGNTLEIYAADTMSLQLKHQTDNSSCWCMVWLPGDRYATGSNDSIVRIWADGTLLHSSVLSRMKAHSDWIRCLTVAGAGQKLISGGMDSSIVLWDLERTAVEWKFAVPSASESMNSIMAVDISQFAKRLATVTREGCVALLDTASSSPITCHVPSTQFPAHSAKTNHIEVSASGTHVLTSARDNAIKLWDLRKCGSNLPPLVTYSAHKCVMYPIPGRFYMDERFVLTGDDENGVTVYETLTGKVERRITMNTGVALTEPMDSSGPDYYCVFVQQQKLAIMQSAGDVVVACAQSAQDVEAERVKNAMQKAIWKFNERIFHHLKAIGKFNMVGYGSLLDVLQTEAEHDEGCRQIITEVNNQYAAYLQEGNNRQDQSREEMEQRRDAQKKVRREGGKTTLAPRIKVEKELRAR